MMLFCSGFALFLALVIGGIGVILYKRDVQKEYDNYASTLVKISASAVNTAALEKCIQQVEEKQDNTLYKHNSNYLEISKQINRIKQQGDIKYIYLVYFQEQQNQSKLKYVMNGYIEGKNSVINELGEDAEGDFPEHMRKAFWNSTKTSSEQIYYINNKTAENEYVRTCYMPVHNTEGKTVCIVCVDILIDDIQNNIRIYIMIIIISLIIVLLVYLIIFLNIIKSHVVLPIKKIALAANDFVQQSYENKNPSDLVTTYVEVNTKDEIELLANSLNHMTREIKNYMVNMTLMTVEKEKMTAEVGIAKQIQRNLFPMEFPAFPERNEFDIYANMNYAKKAGGDFYNFFLIDKIHLCFMIGEVSGQGIPSTMFAVIAATLMKNFALLGYEPNRIFMETNNQLSENNNAELTVSAFLGIIDLDSGKLSYVNAGDIHPLVKRTGSEFMELPAKKCFRLASMEGIPYQQQTILLSQGEMLFLYTEGLAQTMDEKGNVYSDSYITSNMDEILKKEYSLENMVKAVREDVNKFENGVEQERDSTILAFRYLG